MNGQILLQMREEYDDMKINTPLCLYGSYLNSEDICVWYDQKYLCVSDGMDYLEAMETAEDKPLIIYETQDEKKIKTLKKILGMVDYAKRLDELYALSNSDQIIKKMRDDYDEGNKSRKIKIRKEKVYIMLLSKKRNLL